MVYRSLAKTKLRLRIYMAMTNRIEKLFSRVFFQMKNLSIEESAPLKMSLKKLIAMNQMIARKLQKAKVTFSRQV
jgi:hypothetical protein